MVSKWCIGEWVEHLTKPITRQQILDSSKLKEFTDDNLKFDENGRKLPKRVEKNVGKGEIARYEHFLILPQFFQKDCFPGASKGVIVWERVKGKLIDDFGELVIFVYLSSLLVGHLGDGPG